MSKRPLFEKFPYLYCLCRVSPDVFAVLSRMQSFLVISVRLVGVIVTCVIYFIVVPDLLYFTWVCCRVLLLFTFSRVDRSVLVSRLLQMRCDWLIVT